LYRSKSAWHFIPFIVKLTVPSENVKTYEDADNRHQAEPDHETKLKFNGIEIDQNRLVVDKITNAERETVSEKRLHDIVASWKYLDYTVQV
jgi:hypothetical protein